MKTYQKKTSRLSHHAAEQNESKLGFAAPALQLKTANIIQKEDKGRDSRAGRLVNMTDQAIPFWTGDTAEERPGLGSIAGTCEVLPPHTKSGMDRDIDFFRYKGVWYRCIGHCTINISDNGLESIFNTGDEKTHWKTNVLKFAHDLIMPSVPNQAFCYHRAWDSHLVTIMNSCLSSHPEWFTDREKEMYNQKMQKE